MNFFFEIFFLKKKIPISTNYPQPAENQGQSQKKHEKNHKNSFFHFLELKLTLFDHKNFILTTNSLTFLQIISRERVSRNLHKYS